MTHPISMGSDTDLFEAVIDRKFASGRPKGHISVRGATSAASFDFYGLNMTAVPNPAGQAGTTGKATFNPDPNSLCTLNNVPWFCCSGSGTGSCDDNTGYTFFVRGQLNALGDPNTSHVYEQPLEVIVDAAGDEILVVCDGVIGGACVRVGAIESNGTNMCFEWGTNAAPTGDICETSTGILGVDMNLQMLTGRTFDPVVIGRVKSPCATDEIWKTLADGTMKCSVDVTATASGLIVDLADDAVNESTDWVEMATTGDGTSGQQVFRETAADKFVLALDRYWPKNSYCSSFGVMDDTVDNQYVSVHPADITITKMLCGITGSGSPAMQIDVYRGTSATSIYANLVCSTSTRPPFLTAGSLPFAVENDRRVVFDIDSETDVISGVICYEYTLD